MDSRPYSMTCPHCAKTLKYGTGAVGKNTRCPGCGSPVTVPSPGMVPPPKVPPLPNPPRPNPPVLPAEPEDFPPQPIFTEPVFAALPSIPPPVPVELNEFVQTAAFSSTGRRDAPVKKKASPVPKVAGIGIGGVLVIVVLIAGVVYAINQSLNSPLQKLIADDPRNKGIEAKAYYGDIGLSTVVFDLTNISASNSRADVFRVFLHFTTTLKDKRFNSVQLAWRGKVKFIASGEYFQTLGQEFGSQNPMYTIRTFSENLRTPNGDRAFPVWEGGILGVLKAQMDDFSRFHDQWYLDDLSRSI